MTTINGRSMTEKETQIFKDEILKSNEFKKFKNVLVQNNYSDLDITTLDVATAYISDLYDADDKLLVSEMLYFLDKESNVGFHAAKYTNVETKEYKYFLGLNVREGEEVHLLDLMDGSPDVRTVPFNNEKFDIQAEVLPFNDAAYTPGETKDKVDLSDWNPTEFCLAGGYQHCGKNCGYGLKYGGGTPINALDNCCVAHDRCWTNFPNDKCTCNTILVNCAKNNRSASPVASNAIIAAFSFSTC